ncbi:hypothetical protein FA15DRAFT_249661 [Coprinopsis marcescibilis]|uniref:AA9 family lytic polysaccharide monooxygenase n=1 Tax=Coprinopsis marcescibilis TaxID=230819 RepID=A0A5C3KEY5_COPMA|nr:hypothetical protein FA15DRAFT_249661 [Coprinopsis marcescibilis]
MCSKMKGFYYVALLAAIAQSASAHYIFHQLVAGTQISSTAVRTPHNNSPVEAITSAGMTCGAAPFTATETINVAAGSRVGFKLDNALFHPGPAAFYLGQVPAGQTAASWNGNGPNWFKIEDLGAKFNPFGFIPDGATELYTTIPGNTPSGEYLLRIEHIGLHVAGAPQFYISCAQIRVTGGGNGNPTKVSIPGYVTPSDPGLTVNIHWPTPTAYKVPGPAAWRG